MNKPDGWDILPIVRTKVDVMGWPVGTVGKFAYLSGQYVVYDMDCTDYWFYDAEDVEFLVDSFDSVED